MPGNISSVFPMQRHLRSPSGSRIDSPINKKDYPKAVERIFAYWDCIVTSCSSPEEHWVHIRTTKVVGSPFSSTRRRTNAAKRVKKILNATAMIWKLLPVAETYFSTLKGHWLLPDACRGKKFLNGVMKDDSKALERMALMAFYKPIDKTYLSGIQKLSRSVNPVN